MKNRRTYLSPITLHQVDVLLEVGIASPDTSGSPKDETVYEESEDISAMSYLEDQQY